jgi:hypothetical protein
MNATMAARRATRLASGNVVIGRKSNARDLALVLAPLPIRDSSSIGMRPPPNFG